MESFGPLFESTKWQSVMGLVSDGTPVALSTLMLLQDARSVSSRAYVKACRLNDLGQDGRLLVAGPWNSCLAEGFQNPEPWANLFEILKMGDLRIVVPFLTDQMCSELPRHLIEPVSTDIWELEERYTYFPTAGYACFRDYLSGQRKGVRRQLANDRSRFRHAQVSTQVEDLESSIGPICQVVPVNESYRVGAMLSALAHVFGDDAVCFVTRGEAGHSVAYCPAIVYGNELYLRSYYCVPRNNADGATYFTTCMVKPISFAASLGMAGVHSGIGASAAKERRGGRSHRLWSILFESPGVGSRVV